MHRDLLVEGTDTHILSFNSCYRSCEVLQVTMQDAHLVTLRECLITFLESRKMADFILDICSIAIFTFVVVALPFFSVADAKATRAESFHLIYGGAHFCAGEQRLIVEVLVVVTLTEVHVMPLLHLLLCAAQFCLAHLLLEVLPWIEEVLSRPNLCHLLATSTPCFLLLLVISRTHTRNARN